MKMASQQQQHRRQDNTTHEREMYAEKDIVPKRATVFEELAKATAAKDATDKGRTVVAVGVADTREGGKADGVVQRSQHEGDTRLPLEEVTQYRQTAQQNSIDAVQAAQERYAKEPVKHGLGVAAEKISDVIGATTQYISEKAVPTQDTDADISTTEAVAEYVGEKVVAAKDVAVETGKVAAGYAGKVAEGVKDQAVAAGWGVAHKTTEIAVEATKKAGEVLGKAKGVVASAAHKAAELTEAPVVMARDTAVDAGEKLADYAARKKVEAEKYREAKHTQHLKEGTQPETGGVIGPKMQETSETINDDRSGIIEEEPEESMIEGTTNERDSGVLGAIGETIVEIAQHTTQLVGGVQPQIKEKL